MGDASKIYCSCTMKPLAFCMHQILQTYNSHLAVLEAKRRKRVMILILILVLTSIALQWKSQK